MRILFATDGSRPALEGERLIMSLFRRTTGVHVFSVTREHTADLLAPYPGAPSMAGPTVDGEATARESGARLRGAGFFTSWSHSTGYAGSEILAAIDREAADLVVLGASHTSRLGNFLLGSVSTYVLHHTSNPVLITHRAPSDEGRVLIAVDGSESAAAAAQLAATMLDPARCTVHVATVVSGSPRAAHLAMRVPIPASLTTSAMDVTIEERIDRAWELVKRYRSRFERDGFTTVGSVRCGTAAYQLLREVERAPIDLVVAGCGELGPLRKAFAGSVGEHLARRAPATLLGGTARRYVRLAELAQRVEDPLLGLATPQGAGYA